jgi:glycogen operon protein
LGNSQQGNNNVYCQDNQIGWVNWENTNEDLLSFVGKLAKLRKYNAISRAAFLSGETNIHGSPDVIWFNANGKKMTNEQWNDPNNKCMVVKLIPQKLEYPALLVLFNASHVEVPVKIPRGTTQWSLLIDTTECLQQTTSKGGNTITMQPRSVYVFETSSAAC